MQDRDYIVQELPSIWDVCAELGVAHRNAQQDVQVVLDALAEPGEFLCLIHRDAIPPNFVSIDDRLCLFDFEFGGYGHGLVDLAQVRMGFPTYGQPARVPDGVAEATEQVYLDKFADLSKHKISQSVFERALTAAACFWAMLELVGSLKPALDASHPQSKRHYIQLRTRLDALCRLSAQTGHLQKFSALCRAIANEVRSVQHEV